MDEPLTSRPTLLYGRRRHRSGMLLIPGISLSHPAMDDARGQPWTTGSRATPMLITGRTPPSQPPPEPRQIRRLSPPKTSPWPRGSSPLRIRRPATGEGHDILAGPHLWPVVGHRPKGRNKKKRGKKRESRRRERNQGTEKDLAVFLRRSWLASDTQLHPIFYHLRSLPTSIFLSFCGVSFQRIFTGRALSFSFHCKNSPQSLLLSQTPNFLYKVPAPLPSSSSANLSLRFWI